MPPASRSSTRAKCRPSSSSAFSSLNTSRREVAAEQLTQLLKVRPAVRDGNEPPAGPKHARELGERAVDVGHVIEHPSGQGTVEHRVAAGRASGRRRRAHRRREHASARPSAATHRPPRPPPRARGDALGGLSRSAADLEHAARRHFGHRRRTRAPAHRDRSRIGRALRRPTRPRSVAYSSATTTWVVDLHGWRIGVPGMPRPGAFPPSQAFTVAPTSPNSPSWTCPFAFRPAA